MNHPAYELVLNELYEGSPYDGIIPITNGIINIESNFTCQKDLETFSSNLNKINIACENYYSDKTSELIPYESFSELNKKGFVGEDFPIKKLNDEFRVFVLGTRAGGGAVISQTTRLTRPPAGQNGTSNGAGVLSCKWHYNAEIVRHSLPPNVFPAKAGIQRSVGWIPAFAGMTDRV